MIRSNQTVRGRDFTEECSSKPFWPSLHLIANLSHFVLCCLLLFFVLEAASVPLPEVLWRANFDVSLAFYLFIHDLAIEALTFFVQWSLPKNEVRLQNF
jgi:hypothetical protein